MDAQIIQVKYDHEKKCAQFAGIQNGEYMLRMQYLIQAAEIVEDESLKRFYASEMKNIAKRQVLRIDPEIKRLYCKRCSSQLEQTAENFKLIGKKSKKYRKVKCHFCMCENRIYNHFGSSVIIREEQQQIKEQK